jgi:hypothetical protein
MILIAPGIYVDCDDIVEMYHLSSGIVNLLNGRRVIETDAYIGAW